jgi:predicted enzyme related to lactoylglutathione lyase
MHISVVSLNVADLDRAIDFYTNSLGWEKTMDAPMQDENNSRWVTVGPPGALTVISLIKGYGDWAPEKVGGDSGIVIDVDDVFAAADRFRKKGVKFETEPSIEFFGGWARFADSEGNVLGLHSAAPANVSNN